MAACGRASFNPRRFRRAIAAGRISIAAYCLAYAQPDTPEENDMRNKMVAFSGPRE